MGRQRQKLPSVNLGVDSPVTYFEFAYQREKNIPRIGGFRCRHSRKPGDLHSICPVPEITLNFLQKVRKPGKYTNPVIFKQFGNNML